MRVAYQPAARVGHWSLESLPTLPVHQFGVLLDLHEVNDFWIKQAPLTLELHLTDGVTWTWTDVTVEAHDTHRHRVVVNERPVVEQYATVKEA